MPMSWADVFRVLVMLALSFHVFYMYCLARVKADTFGFHTGTTIVAALFALAMLIPLVWAVTLPELPEIWTTHVRARRRWKQGRCPSCGYRIEGAMSDDRKCPECGLPLCAPQGYRINAHTIQRFIALNLVAWILGCVAGESWLSWDEHLYLNELRAQSSMSGAGGLHARQRRWPNSDSWFPFDPSSVSRQFPSPNSPPPSLNTD